MKIVISSFGSSGDFNPCLGLARALRRKGVDVLFLSNPFYKKTITDAGLHFCPSGEYFDVFKEIADNPDYLHPRRGPKAVWKLVLKTVPIQYRAMTELIQREHPDMVASHILEYGGMIAAIETRTPYAVLSPTPMGWFTTDPPGHFHFTELPVWRRKLQSRIMKRLMNFAFKYSLAPLCRKESIPDPIKCLDDVYGKARLNLGFWSDLLKGPCKDDPPHSTICGFVRDEHIKDWPDVPADIQKLFKQEKKPVVVGLGSTASLHGDEIYQKVAKACKELEWPCLLIGAGLDKFTDPERAILATNFAPYGWVFPRAGLVVHHGGLNTTAETLRAGVPGLIIPHAYDQFDNAIRTQKMHLSKALKPRQITTAAIRAVLEDTTMHEKAKFFASRLQSTPDGAETAAELIISAL